MDLSIPLHLCELNPARPLVVGVSGGADSLTLCDLLQRAGLKLVVAHFDHQLRPASAADAAWVGEFARARGLAFMGGAGDVNTQAREQHLSIEEAARTLRYRFLFACAREAGAQAVAVAHTADDQAETVLLHLLRGTGLAGLSGMSFRAVLPVWDAHLPLVRPLLLTWRSEIEAYCRERGLTPREDPTNAETLYLRNRIRHEILPALAEINPQIKQALLRTALSTAADQAYLDEAAGQAWAQVQRGAGAGWLALARAGLLALPPALQRRVLRRAFFALRPGAELGFEAVEAALALAAAPERRRVNWTAGLDLRVDPEQLTLLEKDALPERGAFPQLETGAPLALTLPGTWLLPDGWRLAAEVVETAPSGPPWPSADPFEAWLDADQLPGALSLRPPRPGDRFCPLGLGGRSQKLSDFWVNEHLPRELRARYPLLLAGERVAWVPGFRPANFCRVTAQTRRWLHLTLRYGNG